MCGRYVLKTLTAELEAVFDAHGTVDFSPRYNIAPTQMVPIVRETAEHGRELAAARWGLVPSWSKGPQHRYAMINARAETLSGRSAFSGPLRRRRCLIPADGFYEWRPEGKRKQPWLIRRRDRSVFAFAGLWDLWEVPEQQVIESCTIITTAANALVTPIHDRMPVILDARDWSRWLDRRLQEKSEIVALLAPWDVAGMCAHPVGPRVNSPRNDDPALLEPAEADAPA